MSGGNSAVAAPLPAKPDKYVKDDAGVLSAETSNRLNEQLARFEREVRALCELQHPSIVRYVAHGRTASGQNFLAMAWLTIAT